MIGMLGRSVLTNQAAMGILSGMMDNCFGCSSFPVGFDKNLNDSDANGSTEYDDLGIYVKKLSVNHAKSLYLGRPNAFADDFDFINTAVSIYHEKQHVNQLQKDANAINNSVGTKLTVHHFAKLNNQATCYRNYHWDPMEIDACGVGLYECYQDLSDVLGEPEANRLCCLYENHCIQAGIHLCLEKKPKFQYTDVQDIFRDYEAAFQKSLHRQRIYILDVSEEIGCHCSRFERDRQMLSKEKDGYKQDLMMASVHFQNANLDFVRNNELSGVDDEYG